MATFHYRLQALLDQKLERKREAERELGLRRQELRASEERLGELQEKLRIAEARHGDLRRSIVSGRSAGEDVQRRVNDVAISARRIEAIKDDIMSQRIEIEERKEKVDQAVGALAAATRELEILNKHRDKSERRFRAEVDRKEAIEQDEIASALYETRRRA
jgi:flagellar biosynthesis chaperone FliJ